MLLYPNRSMFCLCAKAHKQDVCGFDYRFWSKSMPKLNRFAKKGDPDRLESVSEPDDRRKVLAAADANERFVAVACVALGLLQILALREPADGAVAYAEFNRTPKAQSVSVRTMREWLRDRVFSFIGDAPGSDLADFILKNLVGSDGYAPRGKDPDDGDGR